MVVRTLVTARWVITLDGAERVLAPGWVLVAGERITELGGGEPPERVRSRADGVVTLDRHVLMPGMVNAHTHLFQGFLRGISDVLPLEDWSEAVIFRFGPFLTVEDVETAALLGCVANLRSGATTALDNHYLHGDAAMTEAVLGAMAASGVRGVVARGATDLPPADDAAPEQVAAFVETPDAYFAEMRRLLREWHGREGRIEVAVAPGTSSFVTEAYARDLGRFAREHELMIHLHVAETRSTQEAVVEERGRREMTYLRDLGLLSGRTQMAHCIWLDAAEIALAAEHGATAVYCPVSNMYLADGVMDLPAMRAAGMRVALGTDGPASDNGQDMLEVLKIGAGLQKVTTLDAGAVTPTEMLTMACRGGAEAVGKGDSLGSLAIGKLADLVAVRTDQGHIGPVHRPESAVVYGARGSDVDWVMVGGRVVVVEGRCVTVNEAALLERAQGQVEAFRKRAGLE